MKLVGYVAQVLLVGKRCKCDKIQKFRSYTTSPGGLCLFKVTTLQIR